jgi:predicted phosphodiesterase
VKSTRTRWVSIALGSVMLALVVGAGLGFAFARATDAQPPSLERPPSSKVFLRAPYLLQPRTDSIIIAWLTPRGVTDGGVAYGLGGRDDLTAAVKVHPQEDGVLHSAVLAELRPGSSYTYSVRSGGEVVHGQFRSLPDSGRIRFTTTGDFGGGTASEAAVVNLMNQQDPDFFITLGDNTYERGTLAEMDQKVFPQYANFLDSHGAVWVLGNHDHTTQQGTPSILNFFMPDRNYSFDAGEAHFIVLEGDGSRGYAPGQPYYEFLRNDLAAHANARWKFVFFHYPAYSCGQHGSTQWVDQYWVPLFDQYHVDAVFNGHDHDYERIRPDAAGVHYFVAGIGGKSADAIRHNCDFQQVGATGIYGDLIVSVDHSTVRVDCVLTGGNLFDTVSWSKDG